MNVLITAGGTSEKIDSVRSISNMSTGRMGSFVAASFSIRPEVEKIFYICGRTAVIPQAGKLNMIYADSVAELEKAVREVLDKEKLDIIVHSMAVSDYRVKKITTVSALLQKETRFLINKDGKISSDVEDMVLVMERTPKIIALFQELSPKSTLVGFKLLDHVSLEILIDKGFEVLTKNKCSFVLANDLKDVTGEKHTGYLIDRKRNYVRYEGKAAIAEAITAAAIDERKNI